MLGLILDIFPKFVTVEYAPTRSQIYSARIVIEKKKPQIEIVTHYYQNGRIISIQLNWQRTQTTKHLYSVHHPCWVHWQRILRRWILPLDLINLLDLVHIRRRSNTPPNGTVYCLNLDCANIFLTLVNVRTTYIFTIFCNIKPKGAVLMGFKEKERNPRLPLIESPTKEYLNFINDGIGSRVSKGDLLKLTNRRLLLNSLEVCY